MTERKTKGLLNAGDQESRVQKPPLSEQSAFTIPRTNPQRDVCQAYAAAQLLYTRAAELSGMLMDMKDGELVRASSLVLRNTRLIADCLDTKLKAGLEKIPTLSGR